MKTIQQIYDEYKIQPSLQLHQLRVAAVAKVIVDGFSDPIDKRPIILACLFHDMGNIIKSDLASFPEFLQPEGLEYWQGLKDEFIVKYGADEHAATVEITKEVGLPAEAIGYIEHVGFKYATENEISGILGRMICNYSDMRVGPHGVLSMQDRIDEALKRYQGKSHTITGPAFDLLVQSLKNMESIIFSKVGIKPEEVTDGNIKGIMEELRKIEI